MKRLLMQVAAICLISCLFLLPCLSTPSVAGPKELTFSFHAPPFASTVKQMMVPWAKDLEAACGGQIKIVLQGGGALFGQTEAYDGLLSGGCDIAYIVTGAYPGRFPLSDITDLPQLFPNIEISAVASHEWLLKHAEDSELKATKLMITLPMAPQQYLGNKEVRVLEDFKGLTIRGAGKNDTTIYKLLGATGVQIPTGDTYSALDTGMVEGMTFTWSGALALGFLEVTKYRTECDIYQPVHQLHMNRAVYNKLPKDIKKIFDEFSTPETSRKYAVRFMNSEASTRAKVVAADKKSDKGPIYVAPASERKRWQAALAPMAKQWIADADKKGFKGQQLYDDFQSIIAKYSK